MGVEFKCGIEVGKDITLAALGQRTTRRFTLAIGAQGGRLAGVPGEEFRRRFDRCGFPSSKLNPDENGTRPHGRTVVIGGGNVAVDVAGAALRAGSSITQMYCLEPGI
ncbi:MAG: FAD-dependent oxidoreductase [Clostridia bacterium]